MKSLLHILLLIAASLSVATAQTEKGLWTVGTQVGNISYRPSSTNRSATALLSPSAGYFVANNVAIGASVPILYSYSRSSLSSFASVYRDTQVGLSPYVRAYLGASKFRPFLNATVGYNQMWNSYTSARGLTKTNSSFVSYGVSAGVAYFINHNITLDASLGYTGGERANLADFFNNGVTQEQSIRVSVGFRLFLGR